MLRSGRRWIRASAAARAALTCPLPPHHERLGHAGSLPRRHGGREIVRRLSFRLAARWSLSLSLSRSPSPSRSRSPGRTDVAEQLGHWIAAEAQPVVELRQLLLGLLAQPARSREPFVPLRDNVRNAPSLLPQVYIIVDHAVARWERPLEQPLPRRADLRDAQAHG